MYYNKVLMLDVRKKEYWECWQQIEDNHILIAYVDKTGEHIKLPKVHEVMILDVELEAIE